MAGNRLLTVFSGSFSDFTFFLSGSLSLSEDTGMVSTALKRYLGVSRTLSPWFSLLMPLCFDPGLALHFEDCFVNNDGVCTWKIGFCSNFLGSRAIP